MIIIKVKESKYEDIMVFRGVVYKVIGASCGARVGTAIARYNNIEDNGIFVSELYESNTLKGLKLFLKSKGHKNISSIKKENIMNLIEVM